MSDSSFDADTFLNMSIDSSMEIRYTPVPKGDYTAHIDGIAVRKLPGEDGGVLLDVTYQVHDAAVEASLGLEKVLVRQGIFLDVEKNGALQLGPNKNIKLARLREALGQNNAGRSWKFSDLVGAGPLKISLEIEPDKKDPDTLYNRVTKTHPLS